MKRSYVKTALLIGCSLFFLAACSGGEEKNGPDEEKGAIKKMTDEVAHEMVDRMNAPKDKASAAVELQEQQNRALEQADELQK